MPAQPISAWGATDVGKKRQHNEDSMLCDPAAGIFIVADGMGGHAAGEVASAKAVEVVSQAARAGQDVLKRLAQDPSNENRHAATALVEQAVQKACSVIYDMAKADSSKRGMGTTIVCLFVAGDRGIIGHVGDSRIYLFRQGQAHRLTEDHTLIAAQLKAGTITKDQANASNYRNVITRAVGIQQSVQVDTLLIDLLPGDIYLLCTDGLHGYLSDDEVPALLTAAPREQLADKFVALANNRGGKDNITTIIVSVGGEAAQSQTADASAKMEALKKIPIFRHLTYKEQTAVLAVANSRTYPAAKEVVVEGQAGDEMFVVVRGRVAIEKNGVEIAELVAGGHFGEMGLVDNAPRSATVRATEPTLCMVIGRPELMNLMRKEQVLAVKLLWSFTQVLSERLRATNAELSEARQELAMAQAVQPFIEEA
jgi:PPM family protein phosphatase